MALFTDGACSGNPGPGGWAYICRDLESGGEREQSGGDARTTNNRMELVAVIEGLRSIDGRANVEIYSDSQYVLKGLGEWMDGWKARGWKRPRNKPVLNEELWKVLDELRQLHQLEFHWIRGHDDHPENERCDRMAVAQAKRFAGSA